MYKHKHGVDMGTVAAAQLLSNTLYYRRFFPIYALAVIAGLDAEGKGYVAGYVSSSQSSFFTELTLEQDAVGSYIRSREGYSANGGSASILMPILDNVFGSGNAGFSSGPKRDTPYSAQEVVEIVKTVFVSGAERDIMLGDAVDIYVLSRSGTLQHELFALKKD